MISAAPAIKPAVRSLEKSGVSSIGVIVSFAGGLTGVDVVGVVGDVVVDGGGGGWIVVGAART